MHLLRQVGQIEARGDRGQHRDDRKDEEDGGRQEAHLDRGLLVRHARQALDEAPLAVVLDEDDEVVGRDEEEGAAMPVEEREVLGQRRMKRAEAADGVEGERQHENRDPEKNRALDEVRHQDAPHAARRRIDEHDRRAEEDAARKRDAEKLRGDDAERVETHRVVEDAEADAAPADELPHAGTVATLQVLDGRRDVRALPPSHEEEDARQDRPGRGPEDHDAHQAVLIADLRVGDEHEAADHRHVARDRPHPPRHLLAAREEVLRTLDEPPHEKPRAEDDDKVRRNDKQV